jgi:hypothetical protein
VISDKTFTSSYENCCSNNFYLVAVKPTPGPKVDLLYIDFQYDDLDTEDARPQVKLNNVTNGAAINASLTAFAATSGIAQTQGGTRW